jgi:glycosyltransferase involved in cell wall biosynthesis
MPLTFSVITCTRNSEPFLAQSIASVLAQDHPHIEYIFVDGGSSDGTLARIRALERRCTLLEGVAQGIGHAMNAGARVASGDVIAHLHSDDYYLRPDVLSTVARHLQASGRGWLFGRIARDIGGTLQAEHFTAPRFDPRRLLRGNFIPHPATFVRRALFQQHGGFDTRLRYAMDYDLWLRLCGSGAPVQLDVALAAFREHAGSTSTRNRRAALEEDFRVRLQHGGRDPLALPLHLARFLVRRWRIGATPS